SLTALLAARARPGRRAALGTAVAEQDHLLHDDRRVEALLVALLAVVAVLDTTLDVQAITLLDVLLDHVGQLGEEGQPVPLGLLLALLAVLATPRAVRRQRDVGHLGPGPRRADLGIGADVAYEHYRVVRARHARSRTSDGW